ncbi:MAG: hypothetical protein P8R42_24215 [Candidatus Binatia bacterium]|nr:hypothetical protein [Candidatus Binatia bacterium]
MLSPNQATLDFLAKLAATDSLDALSPAENLLLREDAAKVSSEFGTVSKRRQTEILGELQIDCRDVIAGLLAGENVSLTHRDLKLATPRTGLISRLRHLGDDGYLHPSPTASRGVKGAQGLWEAFWQAVDTSQRFPFALCPRDKRIFAPRSSRQRFCSPSCAQAYSHDSRREERLESMREYSRKRRAKKKPMR